MIDEVGGKIRIRVTTQAEAFLALSLGAVWDTQSQAFAMSATKANRVRFKSSPLFAATAFAPCTTIAPPTSQKETSPAPAPVEPTVCPEPPKPVVFDLPLGLLIQPWSHQIEGYQFAMRALRQYHGALLAAQMGCGK